MNLRVIFYGFGSIAKQHIKILKSINSNFRFHVIRKKSDCISKDDKITFYRSIKDIKKINLIKLGFVCSPFNFHFKHSLELIKNKINIFVEKPFLQNSKELKNLLFQSKKKKILIQTGFLLRLNPAIKKIKNIIKNNKYGKVINIESNFTSYLPNWRTNDYSKSVSAQKKYGGGVINELVHEVDYLNLIFGKLKCINKNLIRSSDLKTNVEERAFIFLKTKNNIPVFLKLSLNEKILSRYLFINFSKGSLFWDLIKNDIVLRKLRNKKFLIKKIKIKNTMQSLKKIQIKKFLSNVSNKKYGIFSFDQEEKTIKTLNEIKKK